MILTDGTRAYRVEFKHRRYSTPITHISYRYAKDKPRMVKGATRCTIRDDTTNTLLSQEWSYCSVTDDWDTDTGRKLAFTRAVHDLHLSKLSRATLWHQLWLELEHQDWISRSREAFTLAESTGAYITNATAAEEESEGPAQAHG